MKGKRIKRRTKGLERHECTLTGDAERSRRDERRRAIVLQ